MSEVNIPLRTLPFGSKSKDINYGGCIDWGYDHLMAYSCYQYVVVVETVHYQIIQTLRSRGIVIQILWVPRDSPESILLVSADELSEIILWNVKTGIPVWRFHDGEGLIRDMQWLNWSPNSKCQLITLHYGQDVSSNIHQNYFACWDLIAKRQICRRIYNYSIKSFSVNPFDNTQVICLCSDRILFLKYNYNTDNLSVATKSFFQIPARLSKSVRRHAKHSFEFILLNEQQQSDDNSVPIYDCLQISYHQARRNHLILVYEREIYIFDMDINQTVSITSLNDSSSFVQVISVRQRDVLYCLHSNGSISVRAKKKMQSHKKELAEQKLHQTKDNEIDNLKILDSYDYICSSNPTGMLNDGPNDTLRFTCNPMSDKHLAIHTRSGKVVFLELSSDNLDPEFLLEDLLGPWLHLTYEVPRLKLIMVGQTFYNLTSITVIKLNQNAIADGMINDDPLLLAVGSQSGLIQIYDMLNGLLIKEIKILDNVPISGIEWISSFALITYSNAEQMNIKLSNHVFLVNVKSGQSVPLEMNCIISPDHHILGFKVSPCRNYFLFTRVNGPLEIWDLKKLCLLKIVPKKIGVVNRVEWLPNPINFRNASTPSGPENNPPSSENDHSLPLIKDQVVPTSDTSIPTEDNLLTSLDDYVEEQFLFCDINKNVVSYKIRGPVMKLAFKLEPKMVSYVVTALAISENVVITGDGGGIITAYQFNPYTISSIKTGRGIIRMLKIAPTTNIHKPYHFIVVHQDGFDIVQYAKGKFHTLSKRTFVFDFKFKVVDVDWITDKAIVFASEEGFISTMDFKNDDQISAIHDCSFKEPFVILGCLPDEINSLFPVLFYFKFIKSSSLSKDFLLNDDDFACFNSVNEFIKHLSIDSNLVLINKLNIFQSYVNYYEKSKNGKIDPEEMFAFIAFMTGDKTLYNFWKVAHFYIKYYDHRMSYFKSNNNTKEYFIPYNGTTDSKICLSDVEFNQNHLKVLPLDTYYDIICDPFTYKKNELERVSRYQWLAGEYQYTEKLVDRMVLMGSTKIPIQLLLETDPEKCNYYTDAIRAALLAATTKAPDESQNIIKLVATSLISNDKMWEGIQLLVRIGNQSEACQYLITYELWESAVWLAKSLLPNNQIPEFVEKYYKAFRHIKKESAILLLLSDGKFDKVIHFLDKDGKDILAGLFLICIKNSSESIFSTIDPDFVDTVMKKFLNGIKVDISTLKAETSPSSAEMQT